MRREDILQHREDILQWIAEQKSKAYMCKQLKCKPETLNSYLEKMGIEYAGQQGWAKGLQSQQYKTAEEYAKQDNVKSHLLKQKLIKDGIKENKCEICGCYE